MLPVWIRQDVQTLPVMEIRMALGALCPTLGAMRKRGMTNGPTANLQEAAQKPSLSHVSFPSRRGGRLRASERKGAQKGMRGTPAMVIVQRM